MRKSSPLFALIAILLLYLPLDAQPRRRTVRAASINPASCSLSFTGKDRPRVKNRSPRHFEYTAFNGGRSISVPEWFAFVCSLDEDAPAKKRDIPQTVAMDVEAYRIMLRAFPLAVSLEEDNDLHVQVGATAEWEQEQVVVEIPPGRNGCAARTAISEMMRADGWNGRTYSYTFKNPVQADITGYVFLDAHHIPRGARRSDYCRLNGNRAMRKRGQPSPVRGLWEIHPVFKIEPVQ